MALAWKKSMSPSELPRFYRAFEVEKALRSLKGGESTGKFVVELDKAEYI